MGYQAPYLASILSMDQQVGGGDEQDTVGVVEEVVCP